MLSSLSYFGQTAGNLFAVAFELALSGLSFLFFLFFFYHFDSVHMLGYVFSSRNPPISSLRNLCHTLWPLFRVCESVLEKVFYGL